MSGFPGVGCFIFLWQSFLHSFPHCKSLAKKKKKTGFREMAIRSLCGLALLGYLSLGYQSIQLNKVKAVLAKFMSVFFLNIYLIGRSYTALGRVLIIIRFQLCIKT